MCIIEIKARDAFFSGYDFKLSNTEVFVSSNIVYYSLHGNIIAKRDLKSGLSKFTLCGWNTNTTKSRLRSLGVNLTTKKGVVYVDNKEIEINRFYTF